MFGVAGLLVAAQASAPQVAAPPSAHETHRLPTLPELRRMQFSVQDPAFVEYLAFLREYRNGVERPLAPPEHKISAKSLGYTSRFQVFKETLARIDELNARPAWSNRPPFP